MSNPAVLTLAEGNINGQRISIEDNLGEAIHIHIGQITFYLTILEFEELVSSLLDAGIELLAERRLSFDDIDISALDWNWLKKYKQIESIRKKEVCIKNLYTINKSHKSGLDVWHYVGINQSKNYKALMGNKQVLSQYNEFFLYGQNRENRLYDLLEYIKQNGYPFDNKYIIVNQYGVIYDGAHRAAILAFLYGTEVEIPVIEIVFKDDVSVKEYNKNVYKKWKTIKRRKIMYNILSFFSCLVKLKWRKKNKKKTTDFKNAEKINNITFTEFENLVKQTDVNHFYIEKPKFNTLNQKIADIVLVVDKINFMFFKKIMEEQSVFAGKLSCYDNYTMLYSLDRPILYRLKDMSVMACGQMFVKSLFVDSLLPVDSFIIDKALKAIANSDNKFVCKEIILVTTIIDAVFEQGSFTNHDREFLTNNKNLLLNENVKEMLNKEFFEFTDNLINLLINERFEAIIPDFFAFREY